MGITICKMVYTSEFNANISTAKYLRYDSYCKSEINSEENKDNFILYTATIIEDSKTLIFGISKNNSLTLDGVSLVWERESNCNTPVLYNKFYWYIFPLQGNIDLNQLEFNVKAFYKFNKNTVEFKLTLNERPFSANRANLEKYSDKFLSVYSMNLDILYAHALFFRYILQDPSKDRSKQFSQSIKKNLEQVKDSFNNLILLLKEEKANNEFLDFFNTLKNNFRKFDCIKTKDSILDLFKLDYIKYAMLKELLNSKRNLEKNKLEELDNIISNSKRSIVDMLDKSLFDVFYVLYLVQVNFLINKSEFIDSYKWTSFIFDDKININDDNEFELTLKNADNYYNIVKSEASMNYTKVTKDFLDFLTKSDIARNDNDDDVDRTVPLLGFFEKKIKDRLDLNSLDLNKISNDTKSFKFKESIKINFQVREALVNSCLIGVFGPLNAGKSSFIKCLLNNSNNIKIEETKEMSAYQLSDEIDLILVDYPPSNTLNKYYNIQFDNSINMLDYAFLICDSMLIGESLTETLTDAIHSVKVFGVKRLCVIANKIDKLVKAEHFNMKIYLKNIKEYILNTLTKFYDNKYNEYLNIYKNDKTPELEIILKLYEFNRDEYEKHLKIIPTCFDPKVCNNEDEISELKSFGVLFGDSLKRKIAHFILDCIENKKIRDQLRKNILSETIINEKECCFQRVKFDRKQKNFVDLTLSKSVNEGNIHNINGLEDKLKETFSLKSIKFDTEIDSFEKFFIVDDCIFYIEDNGFISCLF